MKKLVLMMSCAAVALGMLAGCGNNADENKTPEQIKAEVASWDSAKIKAVIADYTKAIEAKTKELEASMEELKKIPLKDQLGEEAKKVQAKIEQLGTSLGKLKDNMAAYVEGLKTKK